MSASQCPLQGTTRTNNKDGHYASTTYYDEGGCYVEKRCAENLCVSGHSYNVDLQQYCCNENGEKQTPQNTHASSSTHASM